MSTQVSQMCRSLRFQLHKIGSIRNFLSREATKTLVTSLVLSRLDYCNSLLAGVSADKIKKLQLLQNNAARMIAKQRKSCHITPILKELHWLPVKERICYKLALTCFKCLNEQAPMYLEELLHFYKPKRLLRSSKSSKILEIPTRNYKLYGHRCFHLTGPRTWNMLPDSLRSDESLDHFKKHLKSFLFSSAFY